MKSPMIQYSDEEAEIGLKNLLAKYAQKPEKTAKKKQKNLVLPTK